MEQALRTYEHGHNSCSDANMHVDENKMAKYKPCANPECQASRE